MPSPTLTPDHSAVPGQPAADQDIPGEPPASSGLRLVAVPAGWPPYDCETHGTACQATPGATDPQAGRHPPGPGGRPEPAAPAEPGPVWPRQFAQVIVEILAGSRPSRQLIPWTTDRVRARVDGLTRLFTSDQRPRLQCVMTSQPAVSVVEMTMVIGFGPRSRALALRFEHRPARPAAPGRPPRPARWLCTEIEAG